MKEFFLTDDQIREMSILVPRCRTARNPERPEFSDEDWRRLDAAWEKLGREMGFDPNTVTPTRFGFMAEETGGKLF
ncbi:MAG: hypothetical protein WC373_11860 [Smithella sp.]|jgi:hypothetical protein